MRQINDEIKAILKRWNHVTHRIGDKVYVKGALRISEAHDMHADFTNAGFTGRGRKISYSNGEYNSEYYELPTTERLAEIAAERTQYDEFIGL